MPYTGRMFLVFTATWSKNSNLQDLFAAWEQKSDIFSDLRLSFIDILLVGLTVR